MPSLSQYFSIFGAFVKDVAVYPARRIRNDFLEAHERGRSAAPVIAFYTAMAGMSAAFGTIPAAMASSEGASPAVAITTGVACGVCFYWAKMIDSGTLPVLQSTRRALTHG